MLGEIDVLVQFYKKGLYCSGLVCLAKHVPQATYECHSQLENVF